ncbi:hypothetical protein KGR20_15745 [Cytobacillus oceanisediminis]|nr:hypothetical protein [Bacillus sp. (in: firmicutes)]MBZ9535680.1 hypothetical protein [Cytobacillus oceanisediminis]
MIVLVFTITLLLVSCVKGEEIIDDSSGGIAETKENNETKNNDGVKTDPIISYTEYQSLFEKLVSGLVISGYSLDKSTLGNDLIIVDSDLSFGKREFLTADGSNSWESTQETMYFLNKNKDRLLTITISYTDAFIGNDLVFYNSYEGYDLDESLINNDILTISYKNLLFTILQTSTAQISMDDTVDAGKSIVRFLGKM